MKWYVGAIIGGFWLVANMGMACPNGSHEECVLPRPWGGCAQKVCMPNIENPVTAMSRVINEKAISLAIEGRDAEKIHDREDCMIMVTAGLAVWGTSLGGPWAGLVSGTVGGAASSMACRKAFPV